MTAPEEKVLTLRRPDSCRMCAIELPAGARARYRRADKSVACLTCDDEDAEAVPLVGVAGASARSEYERRRAARERRVREAHPRLGGLLLALQDAPQSEQAWAKGSRGEERAAARLAKLCGDAPVKFLHDRQVPGTRANIDHLAIASSGIYVIDAKAYEGAVDVEVTGGILRPRVETLRVGRRDRTKLVAGVERQLEVVRSTLPEPAPPLHGALCFVDNEFPLLRQLSVRDVAVVGPRRLAKRLRAAGPLAPGDIERLFTSLATALPAAT